jgi:hypothetical protein
MAALLEMVSQCLGLARQAEEKGDLKTALAAIKETHKLLMDLAKLDAARLKAGQPQPAAQTPGQDSAPAPQAAKAPAAAASVQPGQTQAAAQVKPAKEQNSRNETPTSCGAGVSGKEPAGSNMAQPKSSSTEWPPNARGITNLGNYVY